MKTEVVAAAEPSAAREIVAGAGGAMQTRAGVSDPGYNAAAAVRRAVELLKRGEIVALPTETVYGLAADALRAEAVAKIFEAKERPRFDPLIVHLPDMTWLEKLAEVSTHNREIVSTLTQTFWPGPLTLVLPRMGLVPDLVTAGLDTVAVRMSAHPIFRQIIEAFGNPLAAPSANRFGQASPTTAQHVLDELEGRIPLILDAGPTEHGVESTIVALRDGRVEILRPGPITEEDLGGIGCQPTRCRSGSDHPPAADATIVRAPGQLPQHYAPRTTLRLVEGAQSFSTKANQRVGLLAWRRIEDATGFVAVRQLSQKQDLREAAANLFRYLRELDSLKLDLLVAELVPEHGLGVAINDRLRRAATK